MKTYIRSHTHIQTPAHVRVYLRAHARARTHISKPKRQERSFLLFGTKPLVHNQNILSMQTCIQSELLLTKQNKKNAERKEEKKALVQALCRIRHLLSMFMKRMAPKRNEKASQYTKQTKHRVQITHESQPNVTETVGVRQ